MSPELKEAVLEACRKAHRGGIRIAQGSFGVMPGPDGLVAADESKCMCALGAWMVGKDADATEPALFTCYDTLISHGLAPWEVNSFIDGFDGYKGLLGCSPWFDAGVSIRMKLVEEGVMA